LESRILRGALGNGNGFAVFRDPPRNALPDAEFQAVDNLGMRVLGGSKDEFVAFEYVDQAGIALDQCGSKFDNAAQNFVKSVCCTEADADFVEYINM